MIPTKENMVESRQRWFEHVRKRLIEPLVRRVDMMEGSPLVKVGEDQEKL